MPFDQGFFDELASLDSSTVARVPPGPGRLRPIVHDFQMNGFLSPRFSVTLSKFAADLRVVSKNAYQTSGFFRVHPHHVYDYEVKRSFKSQYNVALTNEPDGDGILQAYARVGIGFSFNAEEGNFAAGRLDYANFQDKLKRRHHDFTAAMNRLNGGYAELPDPVISPAVARLLTDRPAEGQEWRFVGARIDAATIMQTPAPLDFARACVDVFNILGAGGFGARY